MQLVLINNRVVAHGENFLSMGGVVINTETGAKYDNATIAECDNCPSDINEVGYEYHSGIFKPCAPYGKGNNNGYFMEVCKECAAPRSSGIPIKGGLKPENFHPDTSAYTLGKFNIQLLWENENPTADFGEQTITLSSDKFDYLLIEMNDGISLVSKSGGVLTSFVPVNSTTPGKINSLASKFRTVKVEGVSASFSNGYTAREDLYDYSAYSSVCKPIKIYGLSF